MQPTRVKAALIGDPNVGKTAIWRQVFGRPAQTPEPTVGADFAAREILVKGRALKLELWDTAGEERFRSIAAAYYRGADFIVAVFDLSRPQTFADLVDDWLAEVAASVSGDETFFLVVGNKRDLVSETQEPANRKRLESSSAAQLVPLGSKKAKNGDVFEYIYAEVSALSSEPIEKALISALEVCERKAVGQPRRTVEVMSSLPPPSKSSCC